METTGTITSLGEGMFSWSLGERQISREVGFMLSSPNFTFKDSEYYISLGKNKRYSLIQTALHRRDRAPLGSLSLEFELRAENERATDLLTVTARDKTYNWVDCATSIGEFLSRRRDRTYRGPLVLRLRLRAEPTGGRQCAGAEVAEECNKALEKDSGNECAGAEVAEESNKALEKDSEYENLKKLQEDLKKLFLNEKNSDVTLKVQGKIFPAHRNILQARSSVFEAMFTHDMEENRSGDVAIEDCDPETFPVFLRYLYTGSTEHVTEHNVCHLFTASDKYEVLLLKAECAEYMKNHLSIETFCDFITLALKHTEEELLRSATEFFCANAIEIAKTPKWQIFLQENSTVGNELFLKAMSRGKIV